MVNFISLWAKQIIIAIIIVIVFELLIPEGKNKKYIELVIGLFILYVIINPITGNKLEKINFRNIIDQSNIEIKSNTINTESLIDDNINIMYKKNIEENISQLLKEKGYIVNKIELKINYDEENYGTIENVILNLGKDSIRNKEIKVDKIEIENTTKESALTVEEADEIKKLISENYYVTKENIRVNE